MLAQLKKTFENPGSEFRGKPFWAWNGALTPSELRRQVRVMHRMGLGGFFMHSRVGLGTAYLSEDWFECVNACIDEAGKLNMEAWLYDEDRWPSGAAGGLVTKNKNYRRRSLNLRVLHSPSDFDWQSSTLAAFVAKVNLPQAEVVRQLKPNASVGKLGKDEKLLVFTVELDALTDWHNGYTYLDVLNDEAVREFIRVTHEAYREHCADHFGRTVPGIFTDEPNHGGKLGGPAELDCVHSLPWTGRLPKVFKERYGYDLIPYLPELFFDIPGKELLPARYHYHDCVTHLFVDAFARQIGEWCDEHGLMHTGHVLAEDNLLRQTDAVGSCMRFYEYMQAPGMDLLTEHWRIYATAKQVSSAARQFGRDWRLTETYGCTGWDFPFAGHKALGDWQIALGINLRCQHLSWYTMEGQAKRDYPASISYQSPWWEKYAVVEDYFARVLGVMTRGKEVRDLLVIHPVESAWTTVRIGWKSNPRVHALDTELMQLQNTLLAAHIDFDYGDEEILSRHGGVRSRDGAPYLQVGKAAYKAVIVPPLRTIRKSTVDLLRRFRKSGGQIIFAGDAPGFVDAERSSYARDLASGCQSADPTVPSTVIDTVTQTARRVSLTGAEGGEIAALLYLLREDQNMYYLFVCNTGETKAEMLKDPNSQERVVERTLAFPKVLVRGFADCVGAPVELDPQSGRMYDAKAERNSDGEWEIRTSFPPLGSRLFVIPKKDDAEALPIQPRYGHVETATLGLDGWNYILSEANPLVLDRPAWRIGDKDWQEAKDILKIDMDIRAHLGIKPRGGQMVQPWARKKRKNMKAVAVELSYAFEADYVPTGEFCLALENPDRFDIWLNGHSVTTDAECGWWTDLSLRKLPIDPSIVRCGRNKLILKCRYDEDFAGLETVYLLGQFGTRVVGTGVQMTAPPKRLRVGDWTQQGLAFYSGSVTYLRAVTVPPFGEDERIVVNVPKYGGVAVRVLINGDPAGIAAWAPDEVDITDWVAGNDQVRLCIEVLGHRRNSHGPLHHAQKWPNWTGPAEFVTADKDWVDDYHLVPCGLLEAPKIIQRRMAPRDKALQSKQ